MSRRIAHPPNRGVPLQRSKSDLDMSNLIQCQTSEPDEESSRTILVLDSSPGRTHPVPVAETYSMASVASPGISDFKLVLPEASQKHLSAPQLKAIKYACCQIEKILPNGSRAGFLIGDGPGVGKGRTIAGIIYNSYLNGRKKAIWFSDSTDLVGDAERDLRDIAAGDIPVQATKSIGYRKILGEGIVLSSYSCLIAESQSGDALKSRLNQLLEWCGDNFDGVIVFDECHRAKNLVPTGSTNPSKTGLAVLELQTRLPNASIIYSSATAATESRDLAYMVRLGLWGDGFQFKRFEEFVVEAEKYGVKGRELLAMEMKQRGMFIARRLSFSDVSFQIEEVTLSPTFLEVHHQATDLWRNMFQSFTKAAKLLMLKKGDEKTMWNQFWSAHQRFYKYLCIAAKVKQVVEVAKKAIESGKCAVINLQSTGESQTERLINQEGQITDFVSTTKRVLKSLIDNHFPKNSVILHSPNEVLDSTSEEEVQLPTIPIPQPPSVLDINEDTFHPSPPKEVLEMVSTIKDGLLEQIEQLGPILPNNPLDQLIDELGGPEKVAEMTGRKGRVVRNDKGEVLYESRLEVGLTSLTMINIKEKQRFMAGEKLFAIFSAALSSGISLHADRRADNQRQRVHITLELPWNADRMLQQFGRTNRSNQVSAPEYIFLISGLAGERRFASIVAKRLEGLGALTHGDRRATDVIDLRKFNIDTNHGRAALESTMKAVMGCGVPVVPAPPDYKGEFFKDVKAALVDVGLIRESETDPGVLSLDKDYANIPRFLNRILGMPVELQNGLFQYFTDTLAANVIKAKESGRFDMGILDLGSGQDVVRRKELYSFTTRHPTGTAKIELQTFEVERGMSWEVASGKCSILSGDHDGFYVLKEPQFTKEIPVLIQFDEAACRGLEKGESLYTISRPDKGLQLRKESLAEIKKKYKKVQPNDAKPLWDHLYASSKRDCWHKFMEGKCKKPECQMGLQIRTFNIVSGILFSYLTKIEQSILTLNSDGEMKIVRLQSGGINVVGVVVPSSCMPQIIKLLTEESENVSKEVF